MRRTSIPAAVERRFARQQVLRHSFLLALAAGASGCVDIQSVVHPRSAAASSIAALWWVMLGLASVISLIVFAILAAALFRRRSDDYRDQPTEQNPPDAETMGRRWIIAGGVAIPSVVLVGLFLYGLGVMRAHEPADEARPFLEIEVVGRQWWWEVTYRGAEPHGSFRSANELHLPVGRPVRIRLRSLDVIHSFWVPALDGKLDLVPGRETEMWIRADSAGTFRGQCAEFCGLQHAKMAFFVVAHPPDDFERWFERERQPAAMPTDTVEVAGMRLFEERGCALCHAIRGTRAGATVGPDLTHLGRRRSLGAGTLVNSRGTLAGWIADPQAAKPGNHMPRVPLSGSELLAITRYLEGLR